MTVEFLPHGIRVCVALPANPETLHPEERAFAETLPPMRRNTWIGGRVALRKALALIGAPDDPLLSDPRGAPKMSSGFVGSISHKSTMAVALADRDSGWKIGVDVEERKIAEIGPRILTLEERRQTLGRPEEILVRFSLKEALYKALDPWVRRYVAYTEVEIRPQSDGSAEVTWRLSQGEGPFHVECWWKADEWIWSTVRVRPS